MYLLITSTDGSYKEEGMRTSWSILAGMLLQEQNFEMLAWYVVGFYSGNSFIM
jgi:hypothetical protein